MSRWVYWSDELRNTLEKISVTGDDRSILRSNLHCVRVITIDYSLHTIYWINHCNYIIQSLRLDGNEATHTYPFNREIYFASGLEIFGNIFFWSENSGIYSLNNSHTVILFSSPLGSRSTGVVIVHPSKQPQGMCIRM